MSTRFVTVHVLTTLGLHNLNRDGNGLPKSQFDGGVQRARLSSQSIKRGARRLYREAGHAESVRTRLGAFEVVRRVVDLAAERGVTMDLDNVIDTAVKGVRSLYAGKTDEKTLTRNRETIYRRLEATRGTSAREVAVDIAAEVDSEATADKSQPAKDTISFLSLAELDAFAESIVADLTGERGAPAALVKDCTSASLDIAAFGRMFAEKQALATHAAVAVSHASTVHQMQLVTDYFTAVEDVSNTDTGAAHIGENYFTSGTYYRSFTIDVDQLARSWSAFNGQHAARALTDLVRSLVIALPGGKVNSTNASVLPALALAEVQNFRVAYGFDEPVEAGDGGGYTQGAVVELARQRRQALAFDGRIFGDAMFAGDTFGADFASTEATSLDELVTFVVEKVYEGR